jgi:hypothetical protein
MFEEANLYKSRYYGSLLLVVLTLAFLTPDGRQFSPILTITIELLPPPKALARKWLQLTSFNFSETGRDQYYISQETGLQLHSQRFASIPDTGHKSWT